MTTSFLLITAAGATIVSPGIADTPLDAVEAALGGECETVFVLPSPTGDAGDLAAYGRATPEVDGVPILFTLPSGDVVGERGAIVVTATDAAGRLRELSAAELARLQPEHLTPHVHVVLRAR